MRKALIVLCIAALFAPPIAADVIPSRPGGDCKAEKAKVKEGLVKRGFSETDAQAHVKRMSADDLEFFAANEGRIQLAGGLLFEEWLLGGLMAAAVVGAALFIHAQANDDE
jgi:hypothetical protein